MSGRNSRRQSTSWASAWGAAFLACALGAGVATAAPIVAPGYTVTEISLSGPAAGDVWVAGDALFVGVGPGFVGQAQSVVRIDSSGVTPLASGFNALSGFAYDPAQDRLVVGDNALEAPGAVTGDTVYAIPDPFGSFASPLAAAGLTLLPDGSLPGIADLILDPADASGNTLLASDAFSNEVLRVDLLSGSQTTLQSLLGFAGGVASDGARLYFGDVTFDAFFNATGTVSTALLPGGGSPTVVATGLPGQYDIEIESGGGLLSTSGPELVRIDPGTGATETVASGFGFATGLFEANGTIWVLDGGFPPVSAVYQLTPIPEPGTLLLVGGGLGLLASRRRRRLVSAGTVVALAVGMLAASSGPAQAARRRPPITFVEPAVEATYMPLALEIDLSGASELPTLQILLNGQDVTPLFQTTWPGPGWPITARAEEVWDGAVLSGANLLDVSVQVTGNPGPSQSTFAFTTVGDPYADDVDLADVVVGDFGGFPGLGSLPAIVTGPPVGGGILQGGLDVFSLGFGGSIVVEFVDNAIVDGPGVDFAVFENAFMVENGATFTLERPFADPAVVSVSQDGVVWHEFPCTLQLDIPQGIVYPGCAGVYPVLSNAGNPTTPHASIPTFGSVLDLIGVSSFPLPDPGGAGGDRFDLADLGISWARYVRVVDPDYSTGDPFGASSAGFDLDAVAAVNSVPATDANANGIPDAVE